MTRTIVKRYNAEIHSQSAIDGILELKEENNITATEVERIDVEIFGQKRRLDERGSRSQPTLPDCGCPFGW